MEIGSPDFLGVKVSSRLPHQSDVLDQASVRSKEQRCPSCLVAQMDGSALCQEQTEDLETRARGCNVLIRIV